MGSGRASRLHRRHGMPGAGKEQPSAPIFVRLIQHRLDYPNLNCELCARLYAQQNLAEYPCRLCPQRIMPEPDVLTPKANMARTDSVG